MSSQDITCEASKQSVNALKYHFKDNIIGSFTVLRQCFISDAQCQGLGVQSFLLSVESFLARIGEDLEQYQYGSKWPQGNEPTSQLDPFPRGSAGCGRTMV